MLPGQQLLVRKLRLDGSEVFRWRGRVLACDRQTLVLAARFNGKSGVQVGPMVLEQGDLFIEFYYFDRWYNVYQVFSEAGILKGWYCNVSLPAELRDGELLYTDLALDVVVSPDGGHLVLDEDEYAEAAATYPPRVARGAASGLRELVRLAQARALPSGPFEEALAALDGPGSC